MQYFLIAVLVGYSLFRIGWEIYFLKIHRGCRTSVQATVVSLRECGRGKYGSFFKPTVSYEHGGVHYSEEITHRYRFDEFAVGEAVEIRVDEDSPSRFLIPCERETALRNIGFFSVFLLLTALLAVGAWYGL